MKISQNCNLLLSDLFLYDFRSCYYNLLRNIGYTLPINIQDKIKRNIEIGIMQKDNPRLSSYLLSSSESLVNLYLGYNNIKDDDIIVLSRDGVILKYKLQYIDITNNFSFRKLINKLIITVDRKKYLSIDYRGEVTIKGFSNKSVNSSYYNLFSNLDFNSKKQIVTGCKYIRETIFTPKEENLLWYCRDNDNGTYSIPIKNKGVININKSSVRSIDIEDIDENQLWETIWEIVYSILLNY